MGSQISAIVLTKNSEKKIKSCLDSLACFDEVVLLDNGSTDKTIDIARRYKNVKVIEHEFIGFGPLRNIAIKQAKYDWILAVDSDEEITEELFDEINALKLENDKVYAVSRLNHYQRKPVKCCGWYPDRVVRLFNRTMTSYDYGLVHESVQVIPGIQRVELKNSLNHFPFDSVAELIDKMQKYSDLYAQENMNRRKASPVKAVLRALFSFFKNYVILRGFLYGYEGLLISVCNANGVFYKYVKLYEENKK